MTKVMETAFEMDRRKKHCKRFLIDKDKTQNEVADELGVSYQSVSLFVNGRLWSQKIADYFGYKRSK